MVCLSFDIEEFDMPLEYKGVISFEEQISVSRSGLKIILDLLRKFEIKATFFSTVVFAQNNLDLIKEIVGEGHELASHTYYHSKFDIKDLLSSKQELESLSGRQIQGLRMPRMMQVADSDVLAAGYRYNSSINPTWLPGRYDNRHLPRTLFIEKGLIQIPASVSPRLRFPLFWLSFHNLPLSVYLLLLQKAYQKDGYLNLYFHPWEFIDIKKKAYCLPKYTCINTGNRMIIRFTRLLEWIKKKNYSGNTLENLAGSFETK
ncbi:MAG: polysaccharide deacetylase family protein [Chitinophagaceae bacterium]|nr:polysaccharide deacetylase family protein [Chitinophagaceae bacterium]